MSICIKNKIMNIIFWENKIGSEVIFTGDNNLLDKNSVGILDSVHPSNEYNPESWCVIIYPQNSAYDYDDKGGWKPKKKAPNKIYSHSVKLSEIKQNLPENI